MQNNVDIFTKESDLDVNYGMIDYGPERELARASLKYIYSDMNNIRHSFISLGFHLSEFERCGYYKDFGYASLAEFSEKNLGLDKSALSRYISVFRRFSMIDDNYSHKMYLDDKYKNFSFSQLSEMVPMSDELISQVKPDMSVKQIRELKKNNVSQKNENVSQVATSQQEGKKEGKDENLKVLKLHGAALQSFIKSCESIDSICINVFDADGKPVYPVYNIWADLIYHCKNVNNKSIYIRLRQSYNDE